jgi:hypothetical protein
MSEKKEASLIATGLSLQCCLSFALFVGLRGLPTVASLTNKHYAKSSTSFQLQSHGAKISVFRTVNSLQFNKQFLISVEKEPPFLIHSLG